MWITSAEVALLGGILCLDRIVIQVMISRPIVVGPIIGVFLNEPAAGLITGAFVELLWIDQLPIGKYVPPNDTVAAVLITAGSIMTSHEIGGAPMPELIALSVLLFAPFALLARKLDILVIESNEKLSQEALEDAQRGDTKAIARKQWWGMAKTFSTSAVLIFVSLVFGLYFLEWLVPLLPLPALRALTLIYCFIPVLGVAIALNTIKLRGALPLFAGLFLVFVVVMRIL